MEWVLLLSLGLLGSLFIGGGSDDPAGGGDDDDDLIAGTADNDTLDGAANDTVRGYGGDDVIRLEDLGTGIGDSGNDTITANEFSDLFGGRGEDVLVGDTASDLYGGFGDDTLDGQGSLYGGVGDDMIDLFRAFGDQAGAAFGGEGNDTLGFDSGGTGTGGAGDDSFVLRVDSSAAARQEEATARITDFETGFDQIVLQADGPILGVELREENGDTLITATYSPQAGLDPDGYAPQTIRLVGVTGFDPADLLVQDDPASGPRGFDLARMVDLRGDGADSVTLGSDPTYLDTRGGDDTVTTGDQGNHSILTGAGNDTVDVEMTGGIRTGDGDDVITLDQADGAAVAAVRTVVFGDGGDDSILITDDSPGSAEPPGFTEVWGGAGDDGITIDQDASGPATVYGGAGADTISVFATDGSQVWLNDEPSDAEPTIDTLTVNVAAGDVGGTGSILINLNSASEYQDTVDLQIDAALTGPVTWVDYEADLQTTFTDYVAIEVGGVEVARLSGSAAEWQDDPRITITRGVVF